LQIFELYGDPLQHAREQNESAHVGGRLDQIGGEHHRFAREMRQLLDRKRGVTGIGGDPGAKKMPDWNAGDREVFDRAQSMDAPVGRRRNFPLRRAGRARA
jgi:hypothetical protein